MKLEELKKMIKEELDAFVANEADDVSVDVDSDDLDAEAGDKGTDDVLRQIFDLLKTHFEADDAGADDAKAEDEGDEVGEDPMEEDMMDEVKNDDEKNEEADLEERAAQGFGDPGAKNTSGKDVGFTPAKTTKGDGKLHEEEKTALQERFQKLANIIK
jgi:hypothetical protein